MTTTTTQWIDAGAQDSVPLDDVIGVAVDGRQIALYSVDGDVYATDNICTHGHGPFIAATCSSSLRGSRLPHAQQARTSICSGSATRRSSRRCTPIGCKLANEAGSGDLTCSRLFIRISEARRHTAFASPST